MIVEFGSGTGWNDLALRLSGFTGSYLGLDISPSGKSAAKQRSAHFELTRSEFRIADMTDRSTWPPITDANYRNATCCTYLSLEQIPGLADVFTREAWLQGITKLILFESSSPRPSNRFSKALTSVYLRAKNYQRNHNKVLTVPQKKGIVQDWAHSAPMLSPRLFNEASIYSVSLTNFGEASEATR